MNNSGNKTKKEDYYKIKDHQLYITKLGTLIKVFSQNKINPKRRGIVLKCFLISILVQPMIWLQKLIYGFRLRRVKLKEEKSPIFILGHWRSGTTHLQTLLAQDPELGTLDYYMNFMVNLCFLGRGWLDKYLQKHMPEKRPMDNIKISSSAPQEEEMCLVNMTSHAAVYSMMFPQNRTYFRKYQLFEGINPKEKKQWAKFYDEVLRMIGYYNKGKRVMTKNPFNTSRVKELLELYPDAKFIYIHRNPYEVYSSTHKLYKTSIETQILQELTPELKEEMIFENYRLILNKYLAERDLIPKGNLVEIGYQDLSEDWESAVQHIYQQLNIPGYEQALPHFKAYMDTVANYEKNRFKPLEEATKARIKEEWGFSFGEWGYDVEHSATTMRSNKSLN